jgi:voltage-gated potassium channel
VKQYIFSVIEEDGDHRASRRFNIAMSALIIVNVLVVILETVSSIHTQYLIEFRFIDDFSIIIFTIEYILRIWTCTLHKKYQDPVTGRLRYAITPLAIVDLLAFLPFYLPAFLPIDLRILRELRLLRLIRVLKLGRYSESLKLFEEVLVRKKEDIIVALGILLMVLVIASSCMYYAEHEAQPEKFASIPHAMWWGIITLATIGYGDIYPITPLGQIIGGFVVVIGIGVFALPTAILAAGFIEVIDARKSTKDVVICPHCGMPLYGVESTSGHDSDKKDSGPIDDPPDPPSK